MLAVPRFANSSPPFAIPIGTLFRTGRKLLDPDLSHLRSFPPYSFTSFHNHDIRQVNNEATWKSEVRILPTARRGSRAPAKLPRLPPGVLCARSVRRR